MRTLLGRAPRTRPRLSQTRLRAALLALALPSALGCRAQEPARSAAARVAPDDAQRSFERGKELALLGDSVRAEQYLAAALQRGHAPPETLRWLIGVCVNGSRLRAAIHYARPYLEAHPEAVRLRYVVATLYLGLGQPLPARELLLEIVERTPAWADPHYLLGVVEWEGFDDPQLASAHFRAYLEREPEGPHAHSAGAWLARHDDTERAAP
jgi:tetratricopeptide (TPR) repeat protein